MSTLFERNLSPEEYEEMMDEEDNYYTSGSGYRKCKCGDTCIGDEDCPSCGSKKGGED